MLTFYTGGFHEQIRSAMKLATFEHSGRRGYGPVVGERVFDLSDHFGETCPDLRALLAGDRLAAAGEALADGALPGWPLDQVQLLPPIPNPNKIFCVGLNYETHRQETGRPKSTHPTLFVRFADTQVGHGAPLRKPRVSSCLDYEGELAVIIGKGGRHIPEPAALEHVAGYACYNDATARDWQRHTSQFTPGKNFPASGGFGPWIVTRDELPDPSRLTLTTRLNGRAMQHATTDLLIFPIPALISYISMFTLLAPGDVISTGTPGGVGFKREPPVYLQAGDRVEVEISGVGILANPVVDEPAPEGA